jgi:hypothetical protein
VRAPQLRRRNATANARVAPAEPLSAAAVRALPAPTRVTALLGLLPLSASVQLILVTGSERVATLRAAPLLRITSTRLLTCGAAEEAPRGAPARTSEGAADEADAPAPGEEPPPECAPAADAAYVAMLRVALAEPGLYFSAGEDVTRCEQSAAAQRAALLSAPDAPLRSFAVRGARLRTT